MKHVQSVNNMAEANLTEAAESMFSEFVQSLGGTVRRLEQSPRPGPDIIFDAEIRGKPIRIIGECKSQGEPRYIREAAEQLREYQVKYPGAYPMVIAPFITERTAELLNSKRVGYFDLAGNALIDYGLIFVRVAGNTRRNSVQRKLKPLFRPRSARILRVVLSDPKKRWYLRDLAKEAGVSIGLVSKVKPKLIELEFAAEGRDVSITKPDDLLNEWSRAYSYTDNEVQQYYSALNPSELEKQLADAAKARNFRYALTMFFGASKVAPFVRYNFDSFYYSGSLDELTAELKLKAAPSGANVWILNPADDGMYYGMRNVGDMAVVSTLQLYLDLANFNGRGEEQAAAIRERLLRY